ncbi:hypothetical protein QFZ56_003717 [Streptomyces achromogenes]|uniref:Uncharacterized protein n=1 Tax=Streptomyces achromogenes TaxID=67255 RepID=A0ABU0Q268_STRAH|nr:hypothetical protein [Streptomyces achromogenes]
MTTYASMVSKALNTLGVSSLPGNAFSTPMSVFSLVTAAWTRAPYVPSRSLPSYPLQYRPAWMIRQKSGDGTVS